MRHSIIRTLAAVMLLGIPALDGPAAAQRSVPDLARATIEDLMNVTVTSASRKEERASEVAAAIYVITRDDIRRSGMTTIPDLLRLAPGVQVAQINASKWAVSVRGFGGLYSNKLLVLGDAGDVVNRGAGWTTETTGGTNGNGTSTIDGETFQIYTAGQAALLVDTDVSVAV